MEGITVDKFVVFYSILNYIWKYVNTVAAAAKEASTGSPLQPSLHRQWYILKAMAARNNGGNSVRK
jgi:hypothetical protein